MSGRSAFARTRYACAAWLLVLMALAPRTAAQSTADALCAEVKIEIAQKASLERQAFNAAMRINNGLETPIQNIAIGLIFQDAAGNGVIATSDSASTSATFFLAAPTLTGISALDGSGSVAAKTTGEVNWLTIPAQGAGGTQAQGKLYFIGAAVTYTIGADTKTVNVTPDTVTVLPQPQLTLDYFLAKDVYADDAFTPQVEPPVPFTLGVRVKNTGWGTAVSTIIESAQPEIVDNQQGLPIGFQILDSFVNDQPAAKTLLSNFGDILPGKSKVGRWDMVTTLSGKFLHFSASYTHAGALGGALTSLLQAVNTHVLVHDVQVDLPGRDAIRDFLAQDGTTLRVYESDGIDTAVTDQSAAAQLRNVGGSQYALSFPATAGFAYVKLADTNAGTVQPGAVVRADGKKVPAQNVWLSKSRNADLSWSYFINFFDVDTTGSYNLTLAAPTPNGSLTGLVYHDTNSNGVQDAGETGVGAVAITLTGTDSTGASINTVATTAANGAFSFVQLAAGIYALQAASVPGFDYGAGAIGTAGGVAATAAINGINLAAGTAATGYAFPLKATAAAAAADLALTMSADATTVKFGDTVVFRLTVTNAGPATATSTKVTALLPSGLNLFVAAPSCGSYDATQGRWAVGDLATGASATLDMTVRVAAAGTITNTATAAATVNDPNPANNTASVSLTSAAATSTLQLDLLASHATLEATGAAVVLATLTNSGPDGATATAVTLSTTSLMLASAQPSHGSYNVTTGIWTIDSLAVGASATLVVRVGNVGNAATVAAVVAQVNGSAPTTPAAGQITLNPVLCNCADLGLQVSASATNAAVGATVDWVITASNRGPAAATGSVATLVVPAALALDSIVAGRGSYDAASGRWTIGTLFAGEAVMLTLHTSVVANTPALVAGTMLAAAAPNLPYRDLALTDNAAQASVNATTMAAAVRITQSVGDAQPGAGDTVTFTLIESNDGPLDATGVSVVDVLPDGYTFVSATPAQGAFEATAGVWSVGSLAANANAMLVLRATANSTLAVLNAALIYAEQADGTTQDNLSRLPLNQAQSDAAVLLATDTLTPNPGQAVQLTVTARNAGPDAASGVVVSVPLPAALTLSGATAEQGDYDSMTGFWQVGSLSANVSATLTLAVTPSVTPTISVAARVHELASHDGNVANNEDTLTLNSTPHAVLGATATTDQALYQATATAQVRVQVTNTGGLAAQGVSVSALVSNSKGAQVHAESKSIATVSMGTSATVVFSFPLAADDADTYEVSITGADSAGDALAPASTTYTLLPPPPSIIAGLVFDDLNANAQYDASDAGLTPATVTLIGVDTKNGAVARSTTTDASGAFSFPQLAAGIYALQVGGLADYVDTVALAGSAGGNGAAGAITGIVLPSNTHATDYRFAKRSLVSFAADVRVSFTASDSAPVQNDSITLTIEASNAGPALAQAAVVTDLLPAGLAFLAATPSAGTYDSASGTWSVGELASGASATLALNVRVTTLATLAPSVTITTITHDPNNVNDSASVLITPVAAADLGLTMTADNLGPSVNQAVTLTLAVHNAGPSSATAVALTALLPGGLTFLTATPSVGSYAAASGVWSVGDLESNASATLVLSARVVAFGSIATNASATSTTNDPNTANNTTSVTLSAVGADLALTMNVYERAPVQNDSVLFTLRVANGGPAVAGAVRVTDLLPSDLNFVSATPSIGTYASATGVWSVGDLANGASATLSLRAQATALSALTNSASAASATGDPNPANNGASVTVTPVAAADLGVTLATSTAQPAHNSNVTLTLTVSNAGPSGANAVVVTALLPAGLNFVAANASTGSYNSVTGSWGVGNLASGASVTLTVIAKVTTLNSITVPASVTAATADPIAANNSANVTLLPLPAFNFTVQTSLMTENRVLVLVSCAALAGENDAQCTASRATTLAAYLTSRGYEHKIVTDPLAFRAELRCGRYNSYWVSGASAVQIDNFADELQVAVLRGDGLVIDGVASVNHHALEAAAGVNFSAALNRTNPLITVRGADFTAGAFTPTGTLLDLKATTGTVEATFSGSGTHAAIVVNNYGFGRSATMAFDLVGNLQAQAALPVIGNLPTAAWQYVLPDNAATHVGGELARVRAQIHNAGDAANLQVIAALPAGSAFAGAVPGEATVTGNQVTWNVALAVGQTTTLELGLRLPFVSGTATVNWAVYTVQASTATPYGTYSYALPVLAAAKLGPQIRSALQALSFAKNSDRKARDQAVAALQNAATSLAAEDYDAAAQLYVAAIIALDDIAGGDVQSYQEAIARLLQEAQRHWCTRLIACGTADAAPQVDSGLDFAAYSSTEVMNARGGGIAPPNWEWALGANTRKNGLFVSNNVAWVSGKHYAWTLRYDGNGNGTYTVKDGAQTLFTNTYTANAGNALRTGNELAFNVNATANAGTAKMQASVSAINGHPLTGSLATAGNNQSSEQWLYYYFPSLATGFTVQGTLALSFTGAKPPGGANLEFAVNAGNTACLVSGQ